MSYAFPVPDYTRISSGIGSRSSPGGIGSTNHQGIDIAASAGSTIVAPTDLTVISAGVRGGLGNTVIGQDAFGNQHIFGHMQSLGVSAGDVLPMGAQLGTVGSTGHSTGPHLHYAVKDKAGKFLANQTQAIVDKGKKLVSNAIQKATGSIARNAIQAVPGGSLVLGATDALGISGDCSIICQIKKWFKETKFWQRLAIVILALVLIAAAFYLLGTGKMQKIVKEAQA